MNLNKYMRRGMNSFVGVLFFAGVGCSQPDPQAMLVGDWKVRPTSAIGQGVRMTDDNTTRRQARELGRHLGSFTVSFRSDGTFTFNMGAPLEGKWTLADKKLTMNVTSMGGQPVPANQKSPLSTFTGELDTKLKVLDVQFPNLGGGAAQVQHLVFEKPEE